MDIILLVLFLAIIVEYIVNLIKPLIPDTDYPIPLVISLVVGVALAMLVQVDILTALGFDPIGSWVGCIVTGLVAGGGSSGVHELLAKLRASRKDQPDLLIK